MYKKINPDKEIEWIKENKCKSCGKITEESIYCEHCGELLKD